MKKRQTENLREQTVTKDNLLTESPQRRRWPLLELVIAQDQKWTAALSICAHEESPLARFRPLMKAMEISFHGLLWLPGTVMAFFMTHRRQDIEMLVNLFFCEC